MLLSFCPERVCVSSWSKPALNFFQYKTCCFKATKFYIWNWIIWYMEFNNLIYVIKELSCDNFLTLFYHWNLRINPKSWGLKVSFSEQHVVWFFPSSPSLCQKAKNKAGQTKSPKKSGRSDGTKFFAAVLDRALEKIVKKIRHKGGVKHFRPDWP